MRRRETLFVLGCTSSIALSGRALAQRTDATWRVGNVHVATPQAVERLARSLARGLADLGYKEGENLKLLTKVAPPDPGRVEATIVDILPQVDLLVVWSTIGAVAARKVAPSIPTVFLSVGAPVEIGLVQSLAHPGGNMTGITFEAAAETYGKRLQVLKEVVPTLTHVGVLQGAGDPNASFALSSLVKTGSPLGIHLTIFDLTSAADLEDAFTRMKQGRIQAVVVVAGALTYGSGKRIADLALQARLPSCHAFKETVLAGGLLSLGPDLVEMARQGAAYVDKILRGAKPADLPVQQPARYELLLNMKTASALGLQIPPSVLARADDVIE